MNLLEPAEVVPDIELPKAERGTGALGRTRRRFLAHWANVLALGFLALMVVGAFLAPWLRRYSPGIGNFAIPNAPPSVDHFFGTDYLGRDIWARLLYGARLSLRTGALATLFAVVVAVPLGVIAGFFRGPVDGVLMRIADGIGAFPPILLAIAIAAVLGAGAFNLSLAVAVVFLPGMMRLTRGQVLAVREETYVEASRSVGSPNRRIVAAHVMPNVAPAVIVQVALSFGFALITEAGLAYLGLGDPPPAASWGSLIQEGYYQLDRGGSYAQILWPALALVLTVLAVQMIGDGLRDAMGREVRTVSRRRLRRLAAVAARRSPAAPLVTADGAVLDVRNLSVEFTTPEGWVRVVDDVSFSVRAGDTIGLVGESGSGKTVSVLAVMGLLPQGRARVASGSVRLNGRELVGASPAALRAVQGSEMAMIFQEPMTSLNPAFSVGNQITEAVRAHRHVSRRAAWQRGVEVMERVGIPDAPRRMKDYPHQFSGGMRQRVMIAMALACEPKVLIADEPTTALDVTIQAQILDLLRELQAELGMAIVFVTHDLGVVADICDAVAVLYAGQVVEHAAVDDLFARPRHPYTQGLLDSMPQATEVGGRLRVIAGTVPQPGDMPGGCRFHPRCPFAIDACAAQPPDLVAVAAAGGGAARARCLRVEELELSGAALARAGETLAAAPGSSAAVCEVGDLTVEFPIRSPVLRRRTGAVHAVDGVDLEIRAAETLGLVGESGSGKSTLGRALLRLVPATSGTVRVAGRDVSSLQGEQLRAARGDMQMVFQDPYSSLDPRRTIAETVGEPLEVHRDLRTAARDEEVRRLLSLVGLDANALHRYPYEFSGGQRQRVAIARALALDPALVVCDEPVSSLDVSTQSQVINLLADLQQELGLAYLFIAHDLSVVAHLSHRVAVMYVGQIVETGPTREVVSRPRHPYTEALLSAVPVPDPVVQRTRERIVLRGDVPSPANPPAGCRFHTRCPYVMDVCGHEDPPPFVDAATGVVVRCHLHTSGPALGGRPLGGPKTREHRS